MSSDEKCDQCGGSGKRMGRTCSGCGGSGKKQDSSSPSGDSDLPGFNRRRSEPERVVPEPAADLGDSDFGDFD